MSHTIYDISPLVSTSIAVWPGDTSVSRHVLCDMTRGDTITLSTLTTTVHVGAHADAPSHYAEHGKPIDEVALETYLGPCDLIEVSVRRGDDINPAIVEEALRLKQIKLHTSRLLLRTNTYPNPEQFAEDFAALTPELVHWAAEKQIHLIGIDTPSVDRFHSKTLPSHHACATHHIAILEGLVLSHVPLGVYELIALPLKLYGFDASPVRAILRTLPHT